MNAFIHVAVAVVRNPQGQVFITQRPQHVHQGGLWEFPGGKVEKGESVLDALRREIKEEIDITILDAQPLIKIPHKYPDKQVILDVWEVLQYKGEPHGKEGQPSRWMESGLLNTLAFPAANRAIIAAVQLPSIFLVTPEPEEDKSLFLKSLHQSIKDGVRWVQLRAKSLSSDKYKMLAREVCDVCASERAKVMLNTDVDTVKALGAGGVHVTAMQLLKLTERPVSQEIWLSASCHNQKEVEHANSIGVDFIFVGSVKETSSHPNTAALGWQAFSQLAEIAVMPVYAIGGMTPEDLRQCRDMGGQGIAAISALWNRNSDSNR